jgi:hypothetical protein
MAQQKSRSRSQRQSSSGSSRRSSSSGSSRSTQKRGSSGASSKRSQGSSRSSGTKRSAGRGGGRAQASRSQQPSSSNGFMEKAKVPATAAGIALIGIAGGLAAAGKVKRRSGILPGGRGPKLPRIDLKKAAKSIHIPKPDGSTIDWVEQKAKDVGDAGYRVAELASEARDVQKAVAGDR